MANIVNIDGVIGWDVTAKDVKEQLAEFAPDVEVEIHVNSGGGSVFEGIAISNVIKAHKGKTTTVITGLAASMGSLIAIAADEVSAHDDATFMIHNAWTFAIGDHNELRKTADVIESLSNLSTKAFSRKTGTEKAEIQQLMDDETWFFGDEIKTAGFADQIIVTEKPEEKEDAVAFNKLVFMESIDKFKNSEAAKTDFSKAAAYLKTNDSPKPAKVPVNSNQKKETMSFKEFLASLDKNPEAKADFEAYMAEQNKAPDLEKMPLAEVLALAPQAKTDHDTAIETTKAEASKEIEAGKLSEADAKTLGAYLSSDYYGPSVKGVCIDAFIGQSDMKTVKMMVALADEQNEKIKGLKIVKTQPAGSGGEQHDLEDESSIKAPKIQAKISTLKTQLNV